MSKRADQSAVAIHLRRNVPEATDEQVDAIVDAPVNWRYRMKRAGEYVERGWSSRHSATGFLSHPLPDVQELDVVRAAEFSQGTVVHRNGGWLVVELGRSDSLDDLYDVRIDEVEVVWRRP